MLQRFLIGTNLTYLEANLPLKCIETFFNQVIGAFDVYTSTILLKPSITIAQKQQQLCHS